VRVKENLEEDGDVAMKKKKLFLIRSTCSIRRPENAGSKDTNTTYGRSFIPGCARLCHRYPTFDFLHPFLGEKLIMFSPWRKKEDKHSPATAVGSRVSTRGPGTCGGCKLFL